MNFLYRFLNIKALNSADAIITNSKLLIPFIDKYFKQSKEKIIAINNGIEFEDLISNVSKKGKINIGIIGKDTEEKNIDLFVSVALQLLNEHTNVNFHICGRGLGPFSRLSSNIPQHLMNYTKF